MSRLFTFGCSFTNYRWSTWADCLAPEFDEFYNWGQSGGGNHFIFNSVMEADQRHKFGAGDTVIVCWTDINREDRYNGSWKTFGNIYHNRLYNAEFVHQELGERGNLIRDLACIKAVKVLLESRRDLTWKFLSMCEIINQYHPDDTTSNCKDVADLYQDVLDSILPGFDKTVFGGQWPKLAKDPHPTPAEHLAYLDWVLPGWVTKQETRVKMQEESVNLRKRPDKSGLSEVSRL